jgi:uncharacterized damage-inducible protein DinB
MDLLDRLLAHDRSLAGLRHRHRRAYATFAVFVRQICDEQRLDDSFADRDDADERLTLASAIIHIIQHNAQHRGEALHILERLGVPDLPKGNPLMDALVVA